MNSSEVPPEVVEGMGSRLLQRRGDREAKEGPLRVHRRAALPGVELWQCGWNARLWHFIVPGYSLTAAAPETWSFAAARYSYRARTVEVTGADLGCLDVGETFVGRGISNGLKIWAFIIDPEWMAREILMDCGAPCAVHFLPAALREPAAVVRFQEAVAAFLSSTVDALEREQRFRELVFRAIKFGCEPVRRPPATGCERAVRRARELIEDRYADHLSLNDLALACGISKYYLERSFVARMGVPLHRYQMLVRLDRARKLLRRGVRPSEAATVTGFSDQAHLTRLFARSYFVTPGRYATGAR